MADSEVRVAVIGCGGIAQHAHLPALQRVAEERLVAVADPYEDVARRVARLNGLDAADARTDHRIILDRQDVDAVVICAPTATHAALAIEALGAGKHVLVEKPMAVTSDEARSMVDASERSGKALMVAYNHTYDAAAEHVKALLGRGELGEIACAEVFFYEDRSSWAAGALASVIRAENQKSFWPRHDDPFERLRAYIHNFDSHVLNLMRVLIGEPRAIEYCRWIEDAGLWAVFDYGRFVATFTNVRLRQPRFEKGIELYGRRKRVRLELAPPLERYTPGRVTVVDIEARTTVEPFIDWAWPFELEHRHFARCILDGTEPLTSGRRALRDVELAEDMARMAVEGACA
jgi:predicted dehydrogenase